MPHSMGRLGTAEMSLGHVLHLRGALQGAGQDHVPTGGAHYHLDEECQEKPTQVHLIVSGIVFVFRFSYLLYYF